VPGRSEPHQDFGQQEPDRGNQDQSGYDIEQESRQPVPGQRQKHVSRDPVDDIEQEGVCELCDGSKGFQFSQRLKERMVAKPASPQTMAESTVD
jgi:hypothetical protein